MTEEIHHNRDAHVIRVHGQDDKSSFQIGSNLTTVHGENGEKFLGRFPESICAETGKTLLSADQIGNAGHIVNDVPLKCGGKQHIKCLEGPAIPLHSKQGLCQMKTDKGMISSMTQSTNQSRVPSSGPGTAVHPKEKRCKIKSGTQDGNEMTSSHAVFHHDVASSCGLVVTRVHCNDQTCSPCNQSCQ